MTAERLYELANSYLYNEITLAELQELDLLLEQPGMQELLEEMILKQLEHKEYNIKADLALLHKEVEQKIAQANQPEGRVRSLRRWIWAAASVALLLISGVYLWFQDSVQQTPLTVSRQLPTDIEPGKDGAILTLADGTEVVLDSLGNGMIVAQNGAKLVLKNRQLAYDPTGDVSGEMVYNTMTTSKGRQFNVMLSDGTKVWLNSASAIKYPTLFTGKERRVEVTGEAYFEVAKDKKRPFRISVNKTTEIEVLGTQFNINSYKDEGAVKTTLLEGSVKVMVNNNYGMPTSQNTRPQNTIVNSVILKPGQQAQIATENTGIANPAADQKTVPAIAIIENADIEKVMAWKKGLFDFNGVKLEKVMQELARWYDIEIVYENGVPDIQFYGEMSRDISLAGLIRALEMTGVHFRIEGRKLVVLQ